MGRIETMKMLRFWVVLASLLANACAGPQASTADAASGAARPAKALVTTATQRPISLADLKPYVGETCTDSGFRGGVVIKDTIVKKPDGTEWTLHRYGIAGAEHNAGLRPLIAGSDGWIHFTSDSGSIQAFQPIYKPGTGLEDPKHLTALVNGIPYTIDCK